MKLKYYISDKILLIAGAIIFLLLVITGHADDSIYVKSGNQIINENFRIVLADNVTSDIIIDNSTIYYYTSKNFYGADKANGTIYYKVAVRGIDDFKQTDNFVYLKTSNVLYKINKTTGGIEQKTNFNNYIDAIYSLFGYGVMSGIPGPQGPPGPQGEIGPAGPQGNPGNDSTPEGGFDIIIDGKGSTITTGFKGVTSSKYNGTLLTSKWLQIIKQAALI